MALGVVVVAWFVNGAALTDPQIGTPVFVILSLAALVGLAGAAFGSRDGVRRGIAIAAASVLVVGSLGFLLVDGLQHRWVSAANQYPNQSVRGSLAAVDVVAAAAGSRPLILVVNDTDANDSTGTNTAYGWAKTYTNVFRTGLPGTSAKYQATYLGSLQNFLAGEVTTSSEGSVGYDRAAQSHFGEVQKRLRDYPQPPAVFLVREYYGGLCNGEATCTPELEQQRLDAAMASGVAIGPDVAVVRGPGLWTPPPAVVAQANQVASETIAALENHPGPLANPVHTLLVIAILAFLLVVPGALAAPWFGLRTTVDRFALIPGTSVVLLLLSGIFTLAVWRGPLTTVKGWAVVGVAVARGPRVPRRGSVAPPPARVVRWVLRPDVRRLLGPVLRGADGGAVHGAGRPGHRAGCDRQVDRVRRTEGLRRPGRAVGRLPAEGRPVALRPLHVAVAVHRRVHRPVPAATGDLVDRPPRRPASSARSRWSPSRPSAIARRRGWSSTPWR